MYFTLQARSWIYVSFNRPWQKRVEVGHIFVVWKLGNATFGERVVAYRDNIYIQCVWWSSMTYFWGTSRWHLCIRQRTRNGPSVGSSLQETGKYSWSYHIDLDSKQISLECNFKSLKSHGLMIKEILQPRSWLLIFCWWWKTKQTFHGWVSQSLGAISSWSVPQPTNHLCCVLVKSVSVYLVFQLRRVWQSWLIQKPWSWAPWSSWKYYTIQIELSIKDCPVLCTWNMCIKGSRDLFPRHHTDDTSEFERNVDDVRFSFWFTRDINTRQFHQV